MKKIFYTMAIAAALFASYSAYNVQNSNELTDIALANVEALAGSNETSSGTVIGDCTRYLVLTTDCHVVCPKCKNTLYAKPRVPNAQASNVSGTCTCGNSDWSI